MKYLLTMVLVFIMVFAGCDLGLFGPDIPDYDPTEEEIGLAFEAIGLTYFAAVLIVGLEDNNDNDDNGDFDIDKEELKALGFEVDWSYDDPWFVITITLDEFEVELISVDDVKVVLTGTMHTEWNEVTEEGTNTLEVFCDSDVFGGTLFLDVIFIEDEDDSVVERFEVNGEDYSDLADDLF